MSDKTIEINGKHIDYDTYKAILESQSNEIDKLKKQDVLKLFKKEDIKSIVLHHMEAQWMWIEFFLSKAKWIISGEVKGFSDGYREKLLDRFLDFMQVNDKITTPLIVNPTQNNNGLSEDFVTKILDRIGNSQWSIEKTIIIPQK